MVIHKREKEFGCDICGKRFRYKGNSTTHLKRKRKCCPDDKK